MNFHRSYNLLSFLGSIKICGRNRMQAKMGLEHLWNDNDRETLKHWREKLSLCHSVDHKSHMDSSGTEHPPPFEVRVKWKYLSVQYTQITERTFLFRRFPAFVRSFVLLTKSNRRAVPWLRPLVAGLSPRRPGFDAGSVHA
jgi:hypothetical protein